MDKPYILGIDIGTGSTKVVAMTLNGRAWGGGKYEYPGFLGGSVSEQNPEAIWMAFVEAIANFTKNIGHIPTAISLSSAMHSIIPVDADGNALGNMITWADTRAEDIAQRIRNSAERENIYRTSGTPIHPMSPLCKLIWIKENQPDLFNHTHKFIGIKEYIWHKLFGAFEVDHSIASATGLFDIRNLVWSDSICAFAGVNAEKFSKPVSTGHTRRDLDPNVAGSLNIPANTPFIIGASDGCCANLGSGATTPGIAALTIGTSGAVRVTGNKPVDNFEAMTFNYLLNETTFVSGGAVNNGGVLVDWLLGNFLEKTLAGREDYLELFETIDYVVAGSDGLLFLPYLYGERAPIWDATASGAFLNIKPYHRQSHFLRATLEGICFALNNVLEALETASGPVTQLNVSGGFISSGVWMQLLADVTGKPLMLVQQEDASAIGAIYLAMQSMGSDLPKAKEKTRMIQPDPQRHQHYANIFPVFKKLYHDTKASIQLLNQLNQSN